MLLLTPTARRARGSRAEAGSPGQADVSDSIKNILDFL